VEEEKKSLPAKPMLVMRETFEQSPPKPFATEQAYYEESLASLESIHDSYLEAAMNATDKFLLHKGGHQISGYFCSVEIYSF
jgi:hypothetical protein